MCVGSSLTEGAIFTLPVGLSPTWLWTVNTHTLHRHMDTHTHSSHSSGVASRFGKEPCEESAGPLKGHTALPNLLNTRI